MGGWNKPKFSWKLLYSKHQIGMNNKLSEYILYIYIKSIYLLRYIIYIHIYLDKIYTSFTDRAAN